MKYTRIFLWGLLMLLQSAVAVQAGQQPEFSTAGFFELAQSGRTVSSMNPAWRFHKGAAPGAEALHYDDAQWGVVSLPHGLEYLPTEASGGINYQGEAWYRKHFTPDNKLKGKKLFLHFEAIMGKSRVYVNGKLLAEHFGGYLPLVVDVTQALKWEADNVIAVWTDNSNDPTYPPGKPQDMLDFCYFGGIYRDCWLVAHGAVYITDPNYEKVTAGGGLFVAYDRVSDAQADICLQLHLRNDGRQTFNGVVEYELLQPDGKQAALINTTVRVKAGNAQTVKDKLTLKQPLLWSPEEPTLYDLVVRIRDKEGNVVDGYRRRMGIRSIEFKGADGFWLNGKPYEAPLIGANRHQDYALVGNAVPNALHWRDAKKLRDAGLKVIRNAHCPQDPAFMDACDELGLFVIVNTPGWQFWNEAPVFAERVYSDIRQMVRRDRNHPCVWLWEPILNETWYPADFAQQALRTVSEEYPFAYCYSGCDSEARGHEIYPVQFAHPANADKNWALKQANPNVTYFTREWGDNVDDWNSHNSPSRVARQWGEQAMLVQARHYACPTYPYTSYDALWRTPRQHVGGCLWHAFDHQRGYHPDPFYGGIMDAFRQPKYAYYMFQSQRPTEKLERPFTTGPMVYIAHEMTPFSPADVTVYSNCDEVRLTYNKNGKLFTYTRPVKKEGMPSPIITFERVYDFMIDKYMSMNEHKQHEVFLRAEGLIGGKVVATHEVRPARRPEQLLLWADHEGMDLRADGSDVMTLVAAVADKQGNIKRLNNQCIRFHIEGEGRIIGNADIGANPTSVKWGTAPVLIQSTLTPGKIRVTASVAFEGAQTPVSAVLELESKPAVHPLIFDPNEGKLLNCRSEAEGEEIKGKSAADLEAEWKRKTENDRRLKEVEQQQADFGEKK